MLKHYNKPGQAHELTFSCYRRADYFNVPVLLTNAQSQRIGVV